jgi:hypothetical protein
MNQMGATNLGRSTTPVEQYVLKACFLTRVLSVMILDWIQRNSPPGDFSD